MSDEVKDQDLEENDETIKEQLTADLLEEKRKKIERFADLLISTNPDDIKCGIHEAINQDNTVCKECGFLKQKTLKYQTHSHTFNKNKTYNN